MVRASSSLLVKVTFFSLLITLSCNKGSGLEGKYTAADDMTKQTGIINLELTANGQGEWAVEEDNVAFKWETRGEEIWLHTKSGGVIVGKISGDALIVNLPGAGVHRFKKVKE